MRRTSLFTLVSSISAALAACASSPEAMPDTNPLADDASASDPATTEDARLGVAPSAVAASGLTTGRFRITWSGDGGPGAQLRVFRDDDPARAIWETKPGATFVAGAVAHANVTESRGSFDVKDDVKRRCEQQTVDVVEQVGDAVRVAGRLDGACALSFTLTFRALSETHLGFDLALTPRDGEALGGDELRASLRYASAPDERFFGFGEQYTYVDLKGRVVPVLVTEQGIGRGEQPLSAALNLVAKGSAGNAFTTWAPVPEYVTSKNRALFLENHEYSTFDLTKDDAVAVTTFGGALHGRILYGKTPLDLVSAYTDYAGRMPALPDWMNQGAIIGMQGGTAKVRDASAKLAAARAPVGAYWLQDWVGKRTNLLGSFLWWNWEVDDAQYPGFRELVSDLRAQGARVMIYVNPFLTDASSKPGVKRNLYAEAQAKGLFVKKADGTTYTFDEPAGPAALVDLSNPAARDFVKSVLKTQMLDLGVSGWMGDFAEALPFEAKIDAAEGAPAFHNRYPEAWQAVQREAIAEAGREGDAIFFSRSGFTQSPGTARLFWLGDQLTSWDGNDGIKTVVKALLSSGFSGYALNHSDIGGYTAVTTFPFHYVRSKELFQRWAELAAFTAVYRTHEGSQPTQNHQYDSDADTLAHFAKFARVYAALAPYRAQLMAEATAHGWPLVRALYMQYPDDPQTVGLTAEMMLGGEYVVAPVLDAGVTSVKVYLPAGTWVDAWSGAVAHSGAGGWITAAAPIGRPGLFFRQGSAEGARFRAALAASGDL